MALDILLKADKATVTLEALKDGKIRVNSSSWAEAVVLLKDQVLVAQWVDGQLNLIRAPQPPEPQFRSRPKMSRNSCDGVYTAGTLFPSAGGEHCSPFKERRSPRLT